MNAPGTNSLINEFKPFEAHSSNHIGIHENLSFGGGSTRHAHHHHHHHVHSFNYGTSKSSNPFCCDKPGSGLMVESPNFNSGSEFKIKSGSKYYHINNYHFGAPQLNNSGVSTSKFFETRAAFKTSYFSCLSTSSKKNEEGVDMKIGGNNLFVGLLDISPPLLHKSVSCFDPIVPSMDFSTSYQGPQVSSF